MECTNALQRGSAWQGEKTAFSFRLSSVAALLNDETPNAIDETSIGAEIGRPGTRD